jgi:hypothetical protein
MAKLQVYGELVGAGVRPIRCCWLIRKAGRFLPVVGHRQSIGSPLLGCCQSSYGCLRCPLLGPAAADDSYSKKRVLQEYHRHWSGCTLKTLGQPCYCVNGQVDHADAFQAPRRTLLSESTQESLRHSLRFASLMTSILPTNTMLSMLDSRSAYPCSQLGISPLMRAIGELLPPCSARFPPPPSPRKE